MPRFHHGLACVAALAAACSSGTEPSVSAKRVDLTPDTAGLSEAQPSTSSTLSEPPPNSPPPPAVCGDLNGGGDQHVDFAALRAAKVAEKPVVEQRQQALLELRYDLSDNPSDVTMTRGKPVQGGVRARLVEGLSWEALAELPPAQVRAEGLFPQGFLPLPHPKQPEGGMLFPEEQIEEVLAQTGRDLRRFDLDLDLPQRFLPEF